MPQCKLITVYTKVYQRPDPLPAGGWRVSELVDVATDAPPQVGDMWFDPNRLMNFSAGLAPYYFAHNAGRPPLIVCLPSYTHFCVDDRTTGDGELGPEGWTVMGDPPNITVQPSIDVKGIWHGWLENGVLRDA